MKWLTEREQRVFDRDRENLLELEPGLESFLDHLDDVYESVGVPSELMDFFNIWYAGLPEEVAAHVEAYEAEEEDEEG